MIPTQQRSRSDVSRMRLRHLYRVGSAAAFVQLGCTLVTMGVVFALGGEPETAEGYYTVLQDDRFEGILRLDFASLLNVALFCITASALYTALGRQHAPFSGLAAVSVFIGVSVSMATHSAVSMIHLSDQFAATASEAERAQLLAAGEAVLAAGWWKSTGGFVAGIFLQGGMVLISVLMLRSERFSRMAAWTGILANGLDLLHLFTGLFLPAAGTLLLSVGGVFYLVWFPSLGRDLYRMAKKER